MIKTIARGSIFIFLTVSTTGIASDTIDRFIENKISAGLTSIENQISNFIHL